MANIKKVFAGFVALVIVFTSVSAFGLSITEEETLMKDVEYRHIETVYGTGWQDIHIVTADLSKEHLAFEVLKDERGGSYLLNTYEMAKNADAVVAINADFFAAKKDQAGRGSAVGMEVKDDALKTTPSVQEAMNVFYQTTDGDFLIDSFEFDITITAPNNKTEKIRHINKYDDLTQICMYTKDWGEFTPGSVGGIIEVVVEDGKVTQKFMEEEGVKIPENGYVLASHLSYNTFLYDSIAIDDEIEIEISATPDYEKIENAVGGGGVLVRDGEAQTKFSHNITGYHPRSAVGIDKTGKKLFLVAVDGRRDGAKGMSQAELAQFMKELGCEHALNLDGGGSTLLVGKKDGAHEVLNAPASTYKRPVANSIGIVTDEELGQTDSIKATSEKVIFAGTKTELFVSGYDKYLRKTEDISPDEVSFKVETSNGYVKNGVFYATDSGTARILAKYKQKSAYIDINVLGEAHRLEFEKDDFVMSPGEKQPLAFKGYDKDGYSAKIDASDVTFGISSNCAVIKNGVLELTKNGSAVLGASFGKAICYATVSSPDAEKEVKPQNVIVPDSQDRYSELSGEGSFRFTVFGDLAKPKTFIESIALNRSIAAVKKQGELYSFVGDVETSNLEELGAKGFSSNRHSAFTHKGSTFITIKSDKGNIYDSDNEQWKSIEEAIKNANGTNLFIFADDIGISSLDVEKRVFEKLFSDAIKNGTNVYVFGAGNKNQAKLIDGVRYIETTGIYDNLGISQGTKDIRDIKYFLVTVNGKNVTYEERYVIDNIK